jgi:hypothetical protein
MTQAKLFRDRRRRNQDLRDTAMKRAEDNARRNWLLQAAVAVAVVARRSPTFTADDVTDQLDAWRIHFKSGPLTHDLRALGPVMLRAVKDGLIEPAIVTDENGVSTGKFRECRKSTCHLRPIRVWKSLIYGQGQ